MTDDRQLSEDQSSDRTLNRDIDATVIPSGTPTRLPAGTKVNITHRLGGNFTVVCDFGLFRINGTDADALGELPPDTANAPDAAQAATTAPSSEHIGPPSDDSIWEQLKTVFDPEIPVNIVDLGLVYSLQVAPIGAEPGKYKAYVAMTLTAPGCGMGPVIAEDARNRVLTVPGVSEAQVDIVWEPPWTSAMISEEGKMELGLL